MSLETKRLYEFGRFRLDAQERLLLHDGEAVPLTPKAFDLLLVLVERHGHLLEKGELMRSVWPDTFVEEANLSYNISLLRKALGESPSAQHYIQTVPRRGYRFTACVREQQVECDEPSADLSNVQQIEAGVEVRVGDEVSFKERLSRGAQTETATTFNSAGTEDPVPLRRWSRNRLARVAIFLSITIAAAAPIWFIAGRWRVNPTAAPARIVPLTSYAGGESHPTFSPDGKQIAFVWGGEEDDNKDIYVKLIGTETPLRLTTNPAPETGPVWSPDGRQIAFLRQAAEGYGFYIIPALGGPERKLAICSGKLDTEGDPARLAWHPDGQLLAVADRDTPAEPVSLFLLNLETGEKRRLTSPPAHFFGDWNPAFSPDGKMFAFTRAVNGISMDIYVAPVSGGEPRRLTFDDAQVNSLAWTPDGGAIVFSSIRQGSGNTAMLWEIPAAGGTPERLTGVGQNVFTLDIDRHGSRLAYEQRIHDTNIYRIDLSNSTGRGASPHSKLISSTFQDNSPDYSPDGKRIVYISDRTGGLELWLCDAEGAGSIQLTNIGGPHTGTPRWSPDGQQIVFDSGVEGNQEIFIISANGGRPRRLTNDPALDMIPSWSRDGRWIYFGSNRGGDFQIWKVPVEGGEARQVTRRGGLEGFESADGLFLYYSKGIGLSDIWRVPIEGGEESLVLELQKSGHRRSWAMAEDGIYFAVAETPSRSAVEFFSFDTRRVERRVAELERSIKEGPPGLTISRDGRWLLYTRIDQSGSDIMLMEDFR